MSEKQPDFWLLFEAVIAELCSMGYMDSSLINYRRLYARLGSFMPNIILAIMTGAELFF